MTSPHSQREFAVEIVERLRDAGHEALWAGGCVRDKLLGLAPKDYDVATSARPDQIRELFGMRRTLAIGAAFGVISVLGTPSRLRDRKTGRGRQTGRERQPIEVATFRSDGVYLDGRHPTAVHFTDAEHDAQRRDFTINGLFFDPLSENVIDYVGGESDLRAGIVRAIGDARARFGEDKLRMLRAVRFAATFDFEIDPGTLDAMREMAAQVEVVSAERIGMELRRMLVHPERAKAVAILADTGLMAQVVSCWPATLDKLPEMLATLNRLDSPSLPLALAALLSQCQSFDVGPKVARELRFTRKEGELTGWLLANVNRVSQAERLPWPAIQRMLIHPGASELVSLHEALIGGSDAGSTFCRQKLALPEAVLNPPPLVDGADLISRGVRPGRGFAQLLEHLRDAQLEGRISGRDDALALADQWLASRGKSK